MTVRKHKVKCQSNTGNQSSRMSQLILHVDNVTFTKRKAVLVKMSRGTDSILGTIQTVLILILVSLSVENLLIIRAQSLVNLQDHGFDIYNLIGVITFKS